MSIPRQEKNGHILLPLGSRALALARDTKTFPKVRLTFDHDPDPLNLKLHIANPIV